MAKLTVKAIQGMQVGKWLSDGGARGAGTLLFRRTNTGVFAYFRYTLPNGNRDTLNLGAYDERGRNGLTLAQARNAAGELSKLYQSGIANIRAHLQAEEDAKKAAEEAQEAARAAAEREALERRTCTLKALCDAYADALEKGGKAKGAKDARSVFRVHIASRPEVANKPANEITPDEIADVLREIRGTGKERTAGVLRSYLMAAYNMAVRARFDSRIPASLKAFNVTSNPCVPIPAIAVQAGQRVLSESELGAYVRSLGEGIVDQALKLALYGGGQRMAQLLRARVADYDAENGVLRLWDSKGKRRTPREHIIPLGAQAAQMTAALVERARAKARDVAERAGVDPDANPSLWISTGGAVVSDTTPGKRVAEIAREICEGNLLDLRDIRRTVETRLAGLGISRETRAQLLSHGLSGVQTMHYDRHTYMDEKRSALEAWEQFLERLRTGDLTGGVVVPLRRSAVV